jgi:peptide/nickel transport system permease protein
MTDMTNIDAAADQKRKEAYFTASQGQLIWQRFKKGSRETNPR